MNIFDLFKKPKMISGVLPDDRPQKEKQKDYLVEEVLATAAPLNWITWEEWKDKPENIKMLNDIEVNNQLNVASCAAQSGSLALAINNYIEDGLFYKFSAKPIYARRRNKPNAGMYMDNLGDICIKNGTLFESLYPSPNDTDINMSNLEGFISAFEGVAKLLKAENYFWLYNTKNIDNFAQILALGKPVVICVVYGDGEFDEICPEIKATSVKYGHAIVGFPFGFFLYKGKKAILIQNSWGNRYYGGRQILTEDWFTQGRILPSIWFEDLNNLAVFNNDIAKPHYEFTNNLYYGMNNSEVAMLQRCLGYEKDDDGYMFPLYQSPTGYFGGLTLKAVKRFQVKYSDEILKPLGLVEPTGYVGESTRKKLNKLFNQ